MCLRLVVLLLAGSAKSMDTMAMSEASIKRAHIGEHTRHTAVRIVST